MLHVSKKVLPLTYQIETNKLTTMKTINETRVAAFRVIDNIITLKANVFNGCIQDRAELEKQMPRLEAIKAWAIANNELKAIQQYFNKTWGYTLQFAAVEVKSIFFN